MRHAKGRDHFMFEEGAPAAIQVEKRLLQHGIRIAPGSYLEAAALSAFRLAEHQAGAASGGSNGDTRAGIASMIGFMEIGTQLLASIAHPDFHVLAPHLKLLNEATAFQNQPSGGNDDASRKLFELLAACWAMSFGSNVIVDDPQFSKGDNPDVILEYQRVRWAIACKTIQSTSPQSVIDNISDGVDQIDRSAAQLGIVLINAKDTLPLDKYWPEVPNPAGDGPLYGCFADAEEPFRILASDLQSISYGIAQYAGPAEIKAIFKARKAIPAIAFWGHTVSSVLRDGRPVPTAVRQMVFAYVRKPNQQAVAFINALNDAAMRIPEPRKKRTGRRGLKS